MVELFSIGWPSAYPGKRGRIESRLREVRGGGLNRAAFGERFERSGQFASQLRQLFEVSARRYGLQTSGPELSVAAFRRPGPAQVEFGL